MERSGIDKLKKACIILPLVVAVIFNSSVAAIDRENNSKLSCGIDSYYVKDMVAQDNHMWLATVYKGNIIKNLIMDCQSYTKYRPNETTGGIFVSWRRKEELPTGA